MTHNEFVEGLCADIMARGNLAIEDIEQIRCAAYSRLHNMRLVEECTDIVPADSDVRGATLRKFIACKMVEGCTKKTLAFYRNTIYKFMKEIAKPFSEITADDIRYYLAVRTTRDKISKVTLNGDRRILSTFFVWLTAEDITRKNPMLLIKQIKYEKRVKKPFTDEEQERLRIAAQGDLRATAIIELLLSTGMRVGELVGLKRDDINGDEAVVFGKGQKERIVFLNARSRVALQMYLETRDDDNESLFVSEAKPHKRLEISGVEIIIRELGKKANVKETHPHKFRRTAATMALNRGMPIDQVQTMLGHAQIATTLIYAKAADDAVKQAHKRLM